MGRVKRERYFKGHIDKQRSIPYLNGFKKGLLLNEDLEEQEAVRYCQYADKRIMKLSDDYPIR